MALFGVAPARGAGSRDALFAARDMLEALDRLNQRVRPDPLPERLRMGVGIHTAQPCSGASAGAGRPSDRALRRQRQHLASRLEILNKEFNSALIVSDAALRASGLVLDRGRDAAEIAVRGRTERLTIHVARNGCALAEAQRTVGAA